MTPTLPSTVPTATVLVVEDDAGIAELERSRLEEAGYQVVLAATAEDALREVGHGGVDLVLLDYRLPGGADGLDFYARVKAAGFDLPVILVTGFGNEATVIQALRVGVRDFVTKSLEYLDYLPEAVGRVLRQVGTERRLAESEARLAGIIESAKDAVIVVEDDRTVSLFNPAAERMFGCPAGAALGRPLTDFIPNELVPVGGADGDPAAGSLTHRLRAGTRGVRAGGEEFPLEATVSPGRAGGRKFYTVVVRDVTDRKRAEAALTLFRALIDRATDAIEVIDPLTGRFLDVNETACLAHGYTRAEYLALAVPDVDPLVAGRPWAAVLEERRAGGQIFESVHRRKDGSTFPVEVSLTSVSLDRDYLVAVVRDITERKRNESERDALLARLQLHIRRMPLAYVLKDADFRIIEWNPTAERIFGYPREEMLGTGPPHERYIPRSFWETGAELLARLRAGDMDAHSVNENLTRDGRTITCQWFNTPIMDDDGRFAGILCLAADVTEQKSLEAQLRQAQKMDAVGRLAGGVAHDFNNLLTVINGYSALLLERLPPGDLSRDLLEEIHKAGERSAGLTRQLLAFSRQQVLAPKSLDLNAVVADTERLLRRVIGEDVRLATALAPGLGTVRADPGQLEQVLMNLAVNARDAMPTGGRLTIETRNVDLDDAYARTHPDARPGPHVLLAVSDTGCGMTDQVMARIFEPFFTTKGPGKGTGLGLATVYGIVKQSGGHVGVYSEVGQGTTFKVYLPRVESAATAQDGRPRQQTPRWGAETVLVVEDEDGVRALTRRVLTGCGYTVLEAADGDEAVWVAAGHPGPIHLLITDVVMPGDGGQAVAERVREHHPEARVLYVSGYTDDAVVRHGILHEHANFLQKPFSPVLLSHKVRDVLDSLR